LYRIIEKISHFSIYHNIRKYRDISHNWKERLQMGRVNGIVI